MLIELKESNLVKKILLSVFFSTQLFMLLGIGSINNLKHLYMIFFSIFIITVILLIVTNIKRWLEFNHKTFKNYLKITLASYMILIFVNIAFIDYTQLIAQALTISIYFSIIFIAYSFICELTEERQLALNVLKSFFKIFIFMGAMIYYTYTSGIALQSEYYKTAIATAITPKDKQDQLKKYEKFVNTQLDIFNSTKIEDPLNNKHVKETTRKKIREFNFFTSISSAIIILSAIFWFVWFINESKIFDYLKRERPQYRQGKKA